MEPVDRSWTGEEIQPTYGSLPLGKGAALWGVVLQNIDPLALPLLQRASNNANKQTITSSNCSDASLSEEVVRPLELLLACQRMELVGSDLYRRLMPLFGHQLRRLDFYTPFDYFNEMAALGAVENSLIRASRVPTLTKAAV